jgi:hypothetical protein
MQTLGYGPDNHLNIKVTARDIPYYRDPAVILIDQLKEVYIDGELEPVDTTNFFPKMMAGTTASASTYKVAVTRTRPCLCFMAVVRSSTGTITVTLR